MPFAADVVGMAPILKAGMSDVKTWDDVKLLTVAINRLKRWTRPGLLCIGDAAHAMSPVGGVGVNLAVQDAVATANLLAAKGSLKSAAARPKMSSMRCAPAPGIPGADDAGGCRSSSRTTSSASRSSRAASRFEAPLFARVVNAVPWLQGITARLVAIGVRPEHVHSPAA